MWELVKAGGWLMLPLVLCSIFTVAISIERFIRLKRSLVLPKSLMLYKGRDIDEVLDVLEQDQSARQSALGYIFKDAVDAYSQGEEYARAQMEVTASREIGYLEKNINFLGTLSAVAPLLGLLGTVIGIIESFLVIDLGSTANPTMMIPGISKALITTAAGMLIAIPALFAYRYFQRLVQEYVAELEQQSTLFHAALFFQKHLESPQRKAG
ncbi:MULTISPECIES: MotA/TolQ/ExbB proton channel family protein [Acinetobacter]|uniref:MotA/TolQ/ExbB proton channel family protein n=1 Tax=Acinetobacter bereziniae TaxID=106648 RepID=A0A8I1DIV9_ACIBZ|nr:MULTISPECIES: MotA/TolQ/ExbB proton channel family protein [Acinetobacter]MEC8123909.1 MotA/TolQ/ExbB proton channel family protein [Pseudomonadota bacterium]MBI0395604.1 MotA/TolQ/ExbB proton channel family protein [Acinetobacter bereziniae]MCU4415934.1 MotA/TolQ/ExbB proton channel family protein [Acinetobacter bereziniae]QQC82957.1 MotA/TolQ/ExbB proton channel family protein [Acinetobacter bereziniae]UUN96102.1 MotA/TolQ/ExbB proton channel family protein [Acinetobacter bereziniae]